MIYGYVRASHGALNATEQRHVLQEANSNEIVQEQDGVPDYSARDRLIETLGSGDTLVVTSLDRLARFLPQLLIILAQITGKGGHVMSVSEGIDTRRLDGSVGQVSQMLHAILSAERGFMVERVQQGRAKARSDGVKLGRRNKLTPIQIAHAQQLLRLGEGGRAVARTFGVSEATLYRNIRQLPK